MYLHCISAMRESLTRHVGCATGMGQSILLGNALDSGNNNILCNCNDLYTNPTRQLGCGCKSQRYIASYTPLTS